MKRHAIRGLMLAGGLRAVGLVSAGDTPAVTAVPANGPISVSASAGTPVPVVERSNPKVVGMVPAGWKIVPLDEAKLESEPVEVRPGVFQTIQVNPYKLVPDQPRTAVKDPGYTPSLRNAQSSTIGAMLTRYHDASTELAEKLEAAIRTLQSALAKPAPVPSRRAP
ncbi:MAG TPA: hypothetical protein VGD78_18020 [Chthoniobacterales bacterium]